VFNLLNRVRARKAASLGSRGGSVVSGRPEEVGVPAADPVSGPARSGEWPDGERSLDQRHIRQQVATRPAIIMPAVP
jgi:hypothetical protein